MLGFLTALSRAQNEAGRAHAQRAVGYAADEYEREGGRGMIIKNAGQKALLEQFGEIINILAPCMYDYLYIWDFDDDFYSISPAACERFVIPASQFHNVNDNLKGCVNKGDWPTLQKDVDRIFGEPDFNFHNLQYRWLSRSGENVWINCRGTVIRNSEGRPIYLVGCINEIGNQQKADNVSGLLGESSFKDEIINGGLAGRDGFIIRIGIDNFKEINENKGMDYGDMVLRKTAECINDVLLPDQKLYKIVADEFIVIDFGGREVSEATNMYARICARISRFIKDNQYEVFYTVSAGIKSFEKIDGEAYGELMKLSEFALNEAKNGGRNKCYVYSEEDYNSFLDEKKIIRIMRRSVNSNFEGFEAYFQPIMDLKSKKVTHAETLLRFRSEETGPVSPARFIPLLEESALIIPVGRWVLRRAAEACRGIRRFLSDFKISFNLSYIQVLKGNALDEILSVVRTSELEPGSIIVELTESGFLEADNNFTSFCRGLMSSGIPLALDDFGTGYSNFHYMYNLNPSIIKIDRSFTLKALSNDYEYNLLQHMADMTHSIGSKFCIEGIETEEELERISGISPDYIQGYYYGKPCPLGEFMDKFVMPSV